MPGVQPLQQAVAAGFGHGGVRLAKHVLQQHAVAPRHSRQGRTGSRVEVHDATGPERTCKGRDRCGEGWGHEELLSLSVAFADRTGCTRSDESRISAIMANEPNSKMARKIRPPFGLPDASLISPIT